MAQKNESKYQIVELKDAWRSGEAPIAELERFENEGWEFVCYNTYITGPMGRVYPLYALFRRKLTTNEFEYMTYLNSLERPTNDVAKSFAKEDWEYMPTLSDYFNGKWSTSMPQYQLLFFRRPKTTKEP